jgi:hypothetical protein
MTKKYKKIKDHEIIPIASVQRIERWHLCQQIGVVYYESQISYDKLLQIKEYLDSFGISDENIIKA